MKKTKFLGTLAILIIVIISACSQISKVGNTEDKQQSKGAANTENNPAPQTTQSVVHQLCRQNLGQNVFPEVFISEDGKYYKLNAYSNQDYPMIYYDIEGIPITTCGGIGHKDMEDKDFCKEASQLKFKSEDMCKLGEIEGKIIVEDFAVQPMPAALSQQEQKLISEAAEERKETKAEPISIKWLYIAIPLILIVVFLGYLEIKRLKGHSSLAQECQQLKASALKQYVTINLRKGYSREQIRSALVKADYSNREIEEAFRGIRFIK